MVEHQRRAARHVADDPGNVEQADDDDAHLQEVGQRHRPHAAEQGVEQHHAHADVHAGLGRDLAVGEHAEHQTQRGDLCRHPAQVGQDDGDRAQHLHRATEAHAVVVTQGQQVELVERADEEQADQDQAQ